MEGIIIGFDNETSENQDAEEEHSIGDITAEMDEVSEDAARLGNMSTALEAYSQLIEESYMTTGAVNQRLLKSIRIGLEAFDDPILSKTVFSNENYGVKITIGSTELDQLISGVKSAGKMMYEVGKNLIKRFFEMLNRAYTYVISRFFKNKRMAMDLTNRLDKPSRWNSDKAVLP